MEAGIISKCEIRDEVITSRREDGRFIAVDEFKRREIMKPIFQTPKQLDPPPISSTIREVTQSQAVCPPAPVDMYRPVAIFDPKTNTLFIPNIFLPNKSSEIRTPTQLNDRDNSRAITMQSKEQATAVFRHIAPKPLPHDLLILNTSGLNKNENQMPISNENHRNKCEALQVKLPSQHSASIQLPNLDHPDDISDSESGDNQPVTPEILHSIEMSQNECQTENTHEYEDIETIDLSDEDISGTPDINAHQINIKENIIVPEKTPNDLYQNDIPVTITDETLRHTDKEDGIYQVQDGIYQVQDGIHQVQCETVMENVKANHHQVLPLLNIDLSLYPMCRICLRNRRNQYNMKEEVHTSGQTFYDIYLTCMNLPIMHEDKKPVTICEYCFKLLDLFYTFRLECKTSEDILNRGFTSKMNKEAENMEQSESVNHDHSYTSQTDVFDWESHNRRLITMHKNKPPLLEPILDSNNLDIVKASTICDVNSSKTITITKPLLKPVNTRVTPSVVKQRKPRLKQTLKHKTKKHVINKNKSEKLLTEFKNDINKNALKVRPAIVRRAKQVKRELFILNTIPPKKQKITYDKTVMSDPDHAIFGARFYDSQSIHMKNSYVHSLESTLDDNSIVETDVMPDFEQDLILRNNDQKGFDTVEPVGDYFILPPVEPVSFEIAHNNEALRYVKEEPMDTEEYITSDLNPIKPVPIDAKIKQELLTD